MSEQEWEDSVLDEWDDEHDRFHPWYFAACDECAERADWLERQRQDGAA